FEGENVTFHPNITGLQINSYYWTFMQNNQTEKIINVIIGETKKIHRTRFEGRLDTDVKNGSITIFNLTLYQVSVPNITKSTAPPTNGVCSVTCSVENGPEVNLTWFRGNISISSSSNQNVSTLTLLQHIRGEDSSTYSCRAQNPVSVQRKTLDSQRLTCHNSGKRSSLLEESCSLSKSERHAAQFLCSDQHRS
uniref:Ig-like domain-containing protein n=1 Tax=Xiphophorus couchianus TaxID=32473 RepID=A0A3B5LPV6_9TELE